MVRSSRNSLGGISRQCIVQVGGSKAKTLRAGSIRQREDQAKLFCAELLKKLPLHERERLLASESLATSRAPSHANTHTCMSIQRSPMHTSNPLIHATTAYIFPNNVLHGTINMTYLWPTIWTLVVYQRTASSSAACFSVNFLTRFVRGCGAAASDSLLLRWRGS